MRRSLAEIESSQKYLKLLQLSGFALQRHKCYFLFSHHIYKRSMYKLWPRALHTLLPKMPKIKEIKVWDSFSWLAYFQTIVVSYRYVTTTPPKQGSVSSFLRPTASRENYIPVTYVWCLSPRNNNQCLQPPPPPPPPPEAFKLGLQ